MSKLCVKCKLDLDDSMFTKHSQKKDGLSSYCRDCTKVRSKQYYEQNSQKVRSKVKEYRMGENREKILERKRKDSKERYKSVEWKQKYSDKRAKQCKSWRQKNPEAVKLYNKKYKTEKSDFCRTIARRRVSTKRTHTLKWLTDEHKKEFDKIFSEMRRLNKEAGTRAYHVDHIIPLNGKEVSGLHVPWNLQILTTEENCSKREKFDGTYENESWRNSL